MKAAETKNIDDTQIAFDENANFKQIPSEKINDFDEDFDDDKIKTKEYRGKTITIELAAGAILGGLSVLIGFMWDMYLESIIKGPNFAPGMTWLDILAVPIIVAFFIFGIRSGLLAAVIGCGAIIFYPTESFGWLAMIPKLIATLSMFVTPWVILKINHSRKEKGKIRILNALDYSSNTFSPLKNYIPIMGTAILSRMILSFIFNLFLVGPVFLYLSFGGTFETVFTQPKLFLTLAGGYTAWNIVQGLSDSILSYLIVFPTKLNKVFGIW
ncbi:MAG: hypothetical protein ACFFDW_00535 [Candidatus Thorarchaeota archaeon]